MPGMQKCPELEVLQQFSLGQLSHGDAWPLHRHLIRCKLCTQTVNELKDAARLITSASMISEVRPLEPSALVPTVAAMPAAASEPVPLPEPVASPSPSSSKSGQAWKGILEALRPAQQENELGRLGDYRILQMLGAGGMGVVFKADDIKLNRLVALKVMKPDQVSDPIARQRFVAEGRSAACIESDYVVTIYQVGEDNGLPFMAMQFLEGEPLDRLIKRQGKLPAAEITRIGRDVAMGLQAAHDRGLIHRDIKPGNIWLESDTHRAKILDFGLVRQTGDHYQHLTRTGFVMGTPGYMSPEQARGVKVDGRTDLFSLGSVLYEMCTGREPFIGSDMMATLMALALESPPPIRLLNAEIPPALAELVTWLLAKSAEDRPRSARVVADSLTKMQANPAAVPISAPPPKPYSFVNGSYPAPLPDSVPTMKAGSSPLFIAGVAVVLFILIALFIFPNFSVAPNDTFRDKASHEPGTSARK
ncbi:MAG TPA: serine/threonine-protein kinase [Gemmataceae bacterium]|jgi:serine/threonine protein kinase|nr:serine/threonine-protein kinase [Gemmataceae bacterium]